MTSRQIASSGRLQRLAPAIPFAVLLPAYAMSLSNHLTEDSLWYAHDILHPGELHFHPHHLLYDPIMRLLILPALAPLGSPEASLLFLQWVNVLFGAAAISVFCAAAMRLGAGALNACAVSLLLGLSAFSYSYSSQIEVYSLTSLFLGVALIGHARSDDTISARVFTAAGFAFALFFHQTAIFFALAVVTDELLARRDAPGRLAGRLAVTLAMPLIFVALVYFYVGYSLGYRTPIEFWHWLTLHVQWGHWGAGTLSGSTLVTAWHRFWQAVIAPGPGQRQLAGVLVPAVGLYVAARIIARGRAAFRRPSLIIGCIVWMSGLAIFTTWWDARGAEFWGMFLMPVCLVLSLLGPAPEERLSSGSAGQERAASATANVAMATMLLVLASTDMTLHQRNETPNDLREAARALPRVARDGDLVLSAGTDGATYYRIYLEERRVEVMAVNVKPAKEPAERCPPGSFTACLLDEIEAHARAVESRGGRLLADGRVLSGRIATTRLTEHLDTVEFSSTLRQRFEAIPLTSGDDPADAAVYELRPRRAATDAIQRPSK